MCYVIEITDNYEIQHPVKVIRHNKGDKSPLISTRVINMLRESGVSTGRVSLLSNWSPHDRCASVFIDYASSCPDMKITLKFSGLYHINRPSCINGNHQSCLTIEKQHSMQASSLKELSKYVELSTFKNWDDWCNLAALLNRSLDCHGTLLKLNLPMYTTPGSLSLIHI